jgi:hypothetical protein
MLFLLKIILSNFVCLMRGKVFHNKRYFLVHVCEAESTDLAELVKGSDTRVSPPAPLALQRFFLVMGAAGQSRKE